MNQQREIPVRVGDLVAECGEVVLTAVGLGSCVAVMIMDREVKVGGMAHVLLPSPSLARDDTKPTRFPQNAVPALIEMLVALGAKRSRLEAKLAGGASMFAPLAQPAAVQMGGRNVTACRNALREAQIPVVAEAVGGEKGRTVHFEVASGEVTIRAVGEADVTL